MFVPEWVTEASMRPEDFSPGNVLQLAEQLAEKDLASMRPEDFSPGNGVMVVAVAHPRAHASMRPEDFSPGNGICAAWMSSAVGSLQ